MTSPLVARSEASKVAIVVGADDPIAVSYLEPEDAWDSGFAVYSVSAEEADDHESELVCLHCPVDNHPELGRGLDLARTHGVVVLNETASGSPSQSCGTNDAATSAAIRRALSTAVDRRKSPGIASWLRHARADCRKRFERNAEKAAA